MTGREEGDGGERAKEGNIEKMPEKKVTEGNEHQHILSGAYRFGARVFLV